LASLQLSFSVRFPLVYVRRECWPGCQSCVCVGVAPWSCSQILAVFFKDVGALCNRTAKALSNNDRTLRRPPGRPSKKKRARADGPRYVLSCCEPYRCPGATFGADSIVFACFDVVQAASVCMYGSLLSDSGALCLKKPQGWSRCVCAQTCYSARTTETRFEWIIPILNRMILLESSAKCGKLRGKT
jgi:hypothetical protein